MKTPVIVVHDCKVYFYKSADRNEWKKYSIHVYGQGVYYWVNSKEPFVIFEYGTDTRINPASLQGQTLEGQIMVEVKKQKNRTCHKLLALQVHPREWEPETYIENPFRSVL